MGKLYRSNKVQWYNNRPVQKVEVVARNENDATVTFKTDYPVEKITVSASEFHSKFIRW